MTKEAINKLNEKQLKFCTTMSALIEESEKKSNPIDKANYLGELRGYLKCLSDLQLITDYEEKSLFLWYHTFKTSV